MNIALILGFGVVVFILGFRHGETHAYKRMTKQLRQFRVELEKEIESFKTK